MTKTLVVGLVRWNSLHSTKILVIEGYLKSGFKLAFLFITACLVRSFAAEFDRDYLASFFAAI